MKKFTCNCIENQFKNPDQVYVGFDEKSIAAILCAYRPNNKVTLRSIKLAVNYCPLCGTGLKELE